MASPFMERIAHLIPIAIVAVIIGGCFGGFYLVRALFRGDSLSTTPAVSPSGPDARVRDDSHRARRIDRRTGQHPQAPDRGQSAGFDQTISTFSRPSPDNSFFIQPCAAR